MVSVTSGWVPGSGAFACPLFSLGRLHCLPLCSSSLLCVASLCSVGFLLLVSFLASPCWTFRHRFFFWLSFVIVARCVLCPSLPLVFHFAVFGGPPVAWWPSVFFWPCSLLFSGSVVSFSCLGLSAPRVWVSRWSSMGFSFVRHCFLSSSRILLLCRGSLCALFFPPLYPFGDFVFFCLQCSLFLLYRLPVLFLVLPFVSLWFRSFSSPASSSSYVP